MRVSVCMCKQRTANQIYVKKKKWQFDAVNKNDVKLHFIDYLYPKMPNRKRTKKTRTAHTD